MPAVFNKETGDLLVVDDAGKWVKPVIAKNPQTGEKIYHDGNEWKPVPLTGNEEGAGLAASALQGPTMGLGDELVAGLENPGYASRQLNPTTIGQRIGNYIMGREEPVDPGQKGYDESLKRFRSIENRYRAANPGKAFVATAGAGLLGGGYQLGRAAFNGAAQLLPNAGRIGQAALAGAEFGGAAGFGTGEGGAADRLYNATLGAGTGALFGTGVEAAVPAVGALIQRVRGNPRLFDPRANRLTPEGERVAREAGLDPAQASVELQREFAQEAQNAVNPAHAAAQAQAGSLPVPVRLRSGQVTLDPAQQLDESQMAKGVYGQLAGNTIRDSEAAQQEALRGNVREIGTRIGGGQVQELGQGVQGAQQALSAAERDSKANVNRLYDEARRGGEAAVEQRAYTEGVNEIFGDVAERFSPDVVPKVSRVLSTLREGMSGARIPATPSPAAPAAQTAAAQPTAPGTRRTLSDLIPEAQADRTSAAFNRQFGDAAPPVQEGATTQPQTLISTIFRVRSQLSALQAEPGVEGAAAGQAKRSIDRWLTNLLDNAALSGDEQAVARWRAAISARRDYGNRFQGGDLVEKLVERAYQGGRSDLKVDPNSAINLIFSRSETGWVGKNGMVHDLMRVRSELGENSQPWNSLREEAFLRFARAGEGAATPTGRDFSGAKFAKSWEDALAKNPDVMRLLFTQQERNLISQFADVARRTTTNVRGGNNTSNTGAAVAQSVRKLFMSSFMGPRLAAFLDSLPVVRGLQDIGQDLRAVRATQGRIAQGMRPQPTPRLNRAAETGTGSAANALVQSVFGDR